MNPGPVTQGDNEGEESVIRTMNAKDINADPASIGLPGSPTQVVKVFLLNHAGNVPCLPEPLMNRWSSLS